MSNKWIWCNTELKGRRAKKYGEPYDAIVTIKIVNGICNAEEMISKNDDIKISDIREIDAKVKELGFNSYVYMRNMNGKMVRTVRDA